MRVIAQQAQAQIKSLQAQFDALDRQMASSSASAQRQAQVDNLARQAKVELTAATKMYTAALSALNKANTDTAAANTKAITAQNQYLAALQKSSVAVQKYVAAQEAGATKAAEAQVAASAKLIKAKQAETKAFSAAYLAQIKLDAAAEGSLKSQAQQIAAADAQVKATGSVTAAQSKLAQANDRLAITQAAISKKTEVSASDAYRLNAARIAVTNATNSLSNAEARLAVVSDDSAKSQAAAEAAEISRKASLKTLEDALMTYNDAVAATEKAEKALQETQFLSASSADKITAAQKAAAAAQDVTAVAAANLAAATEAVTVAQSEVAATAAIVSSSEAAVAAAEEAATLSTIALKDANLDLAASNKLTADSAKVSAVAQGAAGTGLLRNIGRTQFLGKTLEQNFTLPILIAAGAATKFALNNQKAMTDVAKVYGTLSIPVTQARSEINALGGAFEALSDKFGVARSEVIGIGAAWAAAGVSGVALAQSTEITLKTMVLGEMDAASATQALIAIQSQYHLSTAQLVETVNELNIIENQTGVTMQGLIDGMSRAGGSAFGASVDVKHLGAYIAALVPQAGSAATAGNSLKTMFSRLEAPTTAAAKWMALMGINIKSTSWQAMTGSAQIELFAKKFITLPGYTQKLVATAVAGRFQINRFLTLMDQVGHNTGFYKSAMDAASGSTQAAAQATKELNQVLTSSPQRLKIMWATLQNAMADIITPMIPTILMFVQMIVSMVTAFNKLPAPVKEAIVGLLLLTALVGPLIKLKSAFDLLEHVFWVLVSPIIGLGKAVLWLIETPFKLIVAASGFVVDAIMAIPEVILAIPELIAGLPLIIIGALVALVIIFNKQLSQIWNAITSNFSDKFNAIGQLFTPLIKLFDDGVAFIQRGFNALPQGIQNAMIQVIDVISSAVKVAVHLLSYLNPFQRHSPSLVDNVHGGMKAVAKGYSNVVQAVDPVKTATQHIQAFNDATAPAQAKFTASDQAKDLASVLKYSPNAGPQFKALTNDLKTLQPLLDSLNAKMTKQQAVVDRWTEKIKVVDAELKTQQTTLSALQKVADGYSASLSAAQNSLSTFANTPIAGMKAMGDQIFANDQAQKALQLQMMQMEDITGPIADVQAKLQALGGEIETLAGTRESLRAGGAGSDILATYDQQIAALKTQQTSITSTTNAYDAMQKQLDALNHTGQELNLQQSLQFDPLTKQINDLANGMSELPFDKIMTGITNSKADIDTYTAAYNAANTAVQKQQGVVDALQATRDKMQASLDKEQAKLDTLKNRYDAVNKAIQDINSSLSSMVSAAKSAESAAKATSKAAASSLSLAGATAPSVGGITSQLGGTGTNPDQTDQINSYTKGITDSITASFKAMNPFKPIKDAWNSLVKGVEAPFKTKTADGKTIASPLGSAVTGAWSSIKGIDWSAPFHKKVGDRLAGPLMKGQAPLRETVDTSFMKDLKSIGGQIQDIFKAAGAVLRLFMPDIKSLVDVVVNGLGKAFRQLGPPVMQLFQALAGLFGALWNILKPLIVVVGIILLPILKVLAGIFVNVVAAAIQIVILRIKGIIKMFTGVINIITGLLNGDWKKVWEGIKQVVSGALDWILSYFEAIPKLILAIIEGFVTGIIGFFKWLYDELVGHSIIPDLINGIIDWFLSLPKKILNALGNLGILLLQLGKDLVQGLWNGILAIWDGAKSLASWLGGMELRLISAILGKAKSAAIWLLQMGKDVIQGLWNGITAIWDGAKSLAVWLGGMELRLLSAILGKAKNAGGWLFQTGKDLIQGFWNGIQNIWNSLTGWISGKMSDLGNLFKTPVKFLVNTVMDDWIIDNIRHVPGLGGVPEVPRLATGGKVPGHGHGDTVPAMLTPGEFVIRKKAAEKLGLARLKHMNQFGEIQKFGSGGGVTGWFGSVTSGALGKVEGAFSFASGVARDLAAATLSKILSPLVGLAKNFNPQFGDPKTGSFPGSTAAALAKGAVAWVKGAPVKAPVVAIPSGSGVEKWRPVAEAALAQTGMPADWIGSLLHRMNQESGGDPLSVNRWDSNWIAGHPSVGLMQEIQGTFDAYSGPYRDTGPKLYGVSVDPMANIYTSIKYANARYGSAPLGWGRPGGYSQGGLVHRAGGGRLSANQTSVVGELGPELFTPRSSGIITSASAIDLIATKSAKQVISNLLGVDVRSGAQGAVIGTRIRALAAAGRRLNGVAEPSQPIQTNVSVNHKTENHFHGDLSFPNIQDPADAKKFLDNLVTLTKGR